MTLRSVLAIIAAVGSGVTAAVYVNFSARVMPRLAALPDPDGIATMQQFNRNAVQPPFMLCFFGAAVAGLVLIVRVLRATHRTRADALLVAGAGCYLAGFLLTIAYNVPRNDALAAVDANSAQAAGLWRTYLREWTAANTVRAVLSAVGTLIVVVGAVDARRSV